MKAWGWVRHARWLSCRLICQLRQLRLQQRPALSRAVAAAVPVAEDAALVVAAEAALTAAGIAAPIVAVADIVAQAVIVRSAADAAVRTPPTS